jgi:hypothetical protein
MRKLGKESEYDEPDEKMARMKMAMMEEKMKEETKEVKKKRE